MSELLLDSLEIKGYRCFEHLTIEKLGRVNLIVGKNNVGKTALLEALWIWANNGNKNSLFEILRSRNEIPPFQNGNILIQPESNKGLRNLFYNRPDLFSKNNKATAPLYLQISPVKNFDLINEVESAENKKSNNNYDPIWDEAVLNGVLKKSTIIKYYREEHSENFKVQFYPIVNEEITGLFVKSGGMTDQTSVLLWVEIEKDVIKEDFVNKNLALLDNKVKDVRFGGESNRIPVVRREGLNERVPLKSMGEGMTRLLGILLALVNCKNGIFLIDEIEIGLHYSVLPDVWKLIFKTAEELKVQVFATTHSKDCLEAFTQAAVDDKESDGMLIRLVRKNDEIRAFTFDKKELETITNDEIEVR